MKQKLLLFAFTLLSTMLFSQAVPMAFEEWKTTAGTQTFYYKNSTKTDGFGNIYTAGATINSTDGSTDILIAKYNSSGVQLWIKQFSGIATGGTDFAAGLTVTDTYAYLTGAISNNTVVPETDAITMKLAATTGSVVWSTTYSGSAGSHDAGKHITLDGTGDVYITGGSYNASNSDFLTIRYNVTTGSQTWVSTYNYSFGADDVATKVTISGSNVTVSGVVTSAANTYKYATLTYAKSTGSLTATNIGTTTTTSSITAVTDLASDGSGNSYFVGSISVPGHGEDLYIIKTSNTLVTAWTYTYNGASNLDDIARAVSVDASGNVYVSGLTTSSTLGKEIILIKLNSSGAQQWVQTSGFIGNDEASDLVLDASGYPYVTGYRTTDDKDYYTAKYDVSGTKLWEIVTDGDSHLNDNATNIALDSLNNVIVIGQSETSAGTYNFMTTKFVQRDITVPTDLNGDPQNNFLAFTPNLGQLHDTSYVQNTSVKYYNTTVSPAVFIKKDLNSFVFNKRNTNGLDSLFRFDLNFSESNTAAKPYPLQPVSQFQNFYTPNLPAEGKTKVFANQRLVVPDIYTNIDLHYYSNADGIKYYFVVKPGGNPSNIGLHFNGCVTSYTNGSSELIVTAPWDALSFKAPQIYQLSGATTLTVAGSPSWNSIGSNTYKLSLPTYTTSLPLVIMISNVAKPANTMQSGPWYTYLGSYGDDEAMDVITDDLANVYVSGYASDAVLYPQVGSQTVKGYQDAMVVKFDKNANPKWTNLYGGSGMEEYTSLTYSKYGGDSSVYLTGYSTSNVIKAAHTPSVNPNDGTHWDNSAAGAAEPILVRLDPKLGTIRYAQYLGGCNDDKGFSIAADNVRGRIYIAGTVDDHFPCAAGLDFPYTDPSGNSYYTNQNGDVGGTTKDVFIIAIGLDNVIKYATLMGGNATEYLGEIAVNQTTGDFYLTGTTSSALSVRTSGGPYAPLNDSKFPLCQLSGAYTQTNLPSGAFYASFISKFNSNYELYWSTLFNGDGTGYGTGLDVAPNGEVYATGLSYSTKTSTVNCGMPNDDGFPVCNAYQTAAYGTVISADVYLARFNTSNAMTYSTLYGNDDDENLSSGYGRPKLCVDRANNVFVSGSTNVNGSSNAFPTLSKAGLYNLATNTGTVSGRTKSFVLWFDALNTRQWATHYGASTNGGVYGNSIAIYDTKQLYMVGGGAYSNLVLSCPTAVGGTPYCRSSSGNSYDGFITRFDLSSYVGIKENHMIKATNGLSVYPNPSSTNINITFNIDGADTYYLEIYSVMGQLIYKKNLGKTFGEHSEVVNISDYSSGMYIVNLVSSNNKMGTKFIKQ